VFIYANSTYADARTFGIKAATDLYGLLQLKQSLQQMHLCSRVGAAYSGPTDNVVKLQQV
jgi:hypothetical protein